MEKYMTTDIRKSHPRGKYKPVTVRSMTPVEQAWIGAIIEGEGSVIVQPNGLWRIAVANTDPEILSALLRVTGSGKVHKQATNKLATKPCYLWQMDCYLDILSLVRQCSLYSMKLQRIEASCA